MSYNSDVTRVRANDVAIIGMAGRFPRAPDVRRLWENLAAGKEGVVDLSDEELLRAGTDVRLLEHPDLVKRHGVLEDIEWFDAGFFGFTPREAEMLDPQHRLFLECAWEALEGAGYDPQRLERITGMYAGMSSSSYDKLVQATLSGSDPVWQFQAAIALDKDFLTTRVSHKLNLTGPSITVQTACSSSLVAVHLACQSLVHGECDMALAGAAAVSATQRAGYLYREGSIASPDGRCRAFDARAQGTVSGSGVAIVVLKPLAAALEDGDHVHAVIRGSAVNNDGSAKVGFTAPSIGGQAKVIAEALAMADVEPRTIGYVEAHGTGTPLGDPIEIAALNQVFYDCPPGSCVVGALKTNLGHLDTAAGVAGLIKVALALEHGFIPPTLHFERPNPHVDFAGGPFYVSSAGLPWPASGPRRAGVSSFGIGGTNAHVVLEEAPRPEAAPATRPWCLLPLSARTPSALRAARARLAAHLEEHSELALPDVSFTLQTGRSEFQERFAVVARDIPEAVRLLRTGEDAVSATAGPPAGHAAFLFPGQGAQHAGMTAELYAAEPGFREQVNVCCALLREELGVDLRAVIYPAEGEADAASERLEQTALTQPALFVVEYALARLWMARGLQPEAMLGHSVGEYVAACLAGVFTLEDALRLVAARGRLMQSLPGGAMLAVAVGDKELEPLLGPDLSLAAVNGPTACV
ncbi:MAG TPA: type I polyketide synthase, partial [Longimicrobiaceae bacterium]|nr:type I polyketide synthase [Longimicrobiaceae bacterium]